MVYNYTIPRRPIAAMYSSPGPCYALPALTGQIAPIQHDPRSVHAKLPAFTFGLKPPLLNKGISPGPKYFPNCKIYRDGYDGTPHYTMRKRCEDVKPYNNPGPGTYKPEKNFPCSTQPTAPHYSLRDRCKLRALDKTPAPNTYSLPRQLGPTVESTKNQAPLYTMRKKPEIGGPYCDWAKAPGPGTYDSTDPSNYKVRLPQYTMAARCFMPGDPTQKPGPGAHRPELVNLNTKQPEYSFGIRHTQYMTPLIVEPPEIKV